MKLLEWFLASNVGGLECSFCREFFSWACKGIVDEREGRREKVLGGRSRVVITRVQVESREVPRECEHRFFSL